MPDWSLVACSQCRHDPRCRVGLGDTGGMPHGKGKSRELKHAKKCARSTMLGKSDKPAYLSLVCFLRLEITSFCDIWQARYKCDYTRCLSARTTSVALEPSERFWPLHKHSLHLPLPAISLLPDESSGCPQFPRGRIAAKLGGSDILEASSWKEHCPWRWAWTQKLPVHKGSFFRLAEQPPGPLFGISLKQSPSATPRARAIHHLAKQKKSDLRQGDRTIAACTRC